MAREFAKQFYKSSEWEKVRDYVLKRDNYMCIDCGVAPAEEVHHIIHLSPKNIDDISISLNPENLKSLCRACHFAAHRGEHAHGREKQETSVIPQYTFDENGFIVSVDAIGVGAKS